MKGIVTCVRHSGSNTYCVLSLENGALEPRELKIPILLNPREIVEIEGDSAIPLSYPNEYQLQKEQSLYLADVITAAEAKARQMLFTTPYDAGISDISFAVEKMWPKLAYRKDSAKEDASRHSYIVDVQQRCGRAGGAVGLYRALNNAAAKLAPSQDIIWVMHRGVTTTSLTHIGHHGSKRLQLGGEPLVFAIDFGTSVGSNAGR